MIRSEQQFRNQGLFGDLYKPNIQNYENLDLIDKFCYGSL